MAIRSSRDWEDPRWPRHKWCGEVIGTDLRNSSWPAVMRTASVEAEHMTAPDQIADPPFFPCTEAVVHTWPWTIKRTRLEYGRATRSGDKSLVQQHSGAAAGCHASARVRRCCGCCAGKTWRPSRANSGAWQQR